MTFCFLGLGSNLRSPARQLNQAIQTLRNLPRSVITAQSKVYFSQPLGVRSQPPYLNMVIALFTTLPPKRLLHYCQEIEHKHHRVRTRQWGARTLDIDLLLYGEQQIQHHGLSIPHPELLNRDFVWAPLIDIAPNAVMPGGISIASAALKKTII